MALHFFRAVLQIFEREAVLLPRQLADRCRPGLTRGLAMRVD
jgi:hypothetical protein